MTEFTGRVGHLEDIESPWANAGGVVKSLQDVEMMAKTGVGWIEAGSYTLEKRLGNAWNPVTMVDDKTVYYHNPETGVTFNSLGMPNKGMDTVEVEIPEMAHIAHQYNKKLIINVAPVSDEPVAESIELVRRAQAAGADGVLLNAGCPNVVSEDGGRHELLSKSPVSFGRVLAGLSQANLSQPIWVRLSPQEGLQNMNKTTAHILGSRVVSAVLTPNTWGGHKPVDKKDKYILDVPGNMGGMSGPAMSTFAYRETLYAVQALRHSKVDVICSSGIMNGDKLRRSLLLGAVAGAGTTFYYESQNGWADDTGRLLSELAA